MLNLPKYRWFQASLWSTLLKSTILWLDRAAVLQKFTILQNAARFLTWLFIDVSACTFDYFDWQSRFFHLSVYGWIISDSTSPQGIVSVSGVSSNVIYEKNAFTRRTIVQRTRAFYQYLFRTYNWWYVRFFPNLMLHFNSFYTTALSSTLIYRGIPHLGIKWILSEAKIKSI